MKALLAFATVVAAIAATAPGTLAGYDPHAYVYGGASVAVAEAIQTSGTGSYNRHAYVHGGASAGVASAIQAAGKQTNTAGNATPQGYTFITDTLGGNGHPKHVQPQGYTLITDTLAPGGGPAVQANGSGSSSFSWSDAGVGAATAVGSLLVLLGGVLLVVRRRERLAI